MSQTVTSPIRAPRSRSFALFSTIVTIVAVLLAHGCRDEPDEESGTVATWARSNTHRQVADSPPLWDAAVEQSGTGTTTPSPTGTTVPATASAVEANDDDAPVVVARAGEFTVTLDQYRAALARGTLQGRPYGERTLADPQFQRSLLTRLLRRAALEPLAAELDIEIDEEDVRRHLAATPAFQEIADAPTLEIDAWAKENLGLAPEVFWSFVREDALVDRTTEVLLDRIDDDALWERWERVKTRVAIEAVRVHNVPASDEISRFVERHPDLIEARFRDHRSRFQQPALATVRRFLVGVARDADDATWAEAKRRAETFRRRALTEDMGQLAANASDDLFTRGREGLMLPVPRERLPLAFELDVGAVSEVFRAPDGMAFIKVEGRTPARSHPLDDGVRRQLASELIQERGPAPSVAEVLESVLAIWRAADDPDSDTTGAAVDALLEPVRGERMRIAAFPYDPQGRIPGLGLAPAVHEQAHGLRSAAPVGDEPAVAGQYAWAIRLRERTEPDRLEFRANLDSFRDAVRARERPHILVETIDERVGGEVELDLRRVQEAFGVLQRDGSVRDIDGSGE